MWHHQRRQSPEGTIAVHAPERSNGGNAMPWVVVFVEDNITCHWPTQCLSAQAVANWQVLRVHEPWKAEAA